MTLPGLVVLLTLAAFADQLLLRAGRALVPRDDEEGGAPPRRTTIDLGGGTAVVRRPGS